MTFITNQGTLPPHVASSICIFLFVVTTNIDICLYRKDKFVLEKMAKDSTGNSQKKLSKWSPHHYSSRKCKYTPNGILLYTPEWL